jgi:hypothetical protein
MRAAMEQSRAQLQQLRLQSRSSILAALTPAHRTMVATIVGQLALSPNPNPRAAASSLDAVLLPNEKQSILNIDAAVRTNSRAIMQQARSAFEASLTADQKAKLAARQAQMAANRQAHPHIARVADPGTIVLRTLADMGGPGPGPHGHGFGP